MFLTDCDLKRRFRLVNLQHLPKIQLCQLKWTWNRTVEKTDLNIRHGDFECPFSGIEPNTTLSEDIICHVTVTISSLTYPG